MNKNTGRALISVYHKEGIEEVAGLLSKNGWEIISTGGTSKYLQKKGIDVTPVTSLTKFPEILDGRVKTLHPAIFAPILSKKDKHHLNELKSQGMEKIDLVIINFYPFEEYLDKKDSTLKEMIEKIDIGGPSMVRAASKNFSDTIVVVDNKDYMKITKLIISGTGPDGDLKRKLAAKAFSYTSFYDSLIAGYLLDENLLASEYFSVSGRKYADLRYGENPHQKSAMYINKNDSPFNSLEQLGGKALSYNNILDFSMVYEVLTSFSDTNKSFCVIVKHQNPCGASLRDTLSSSFESALSGDPVSAFGGIVGFNKKVDEETAVKINKIFFELVIAPDFTAGAISILKKKKNLRIIKIDTGFIEKNDIKTIPGGFIVQERDNLSQELSEFEIKTGNLSREDLKGDLFFGWKLIKFVKSNAIIIVKNNKLIGVGAGQMSRIDSVDIAIRGSNNNDIQGACMISDAFFPFKDSIEKAAGAGIKTIVEPGGSIRDKEVIDEAKSKGITLVFTGIRHFRH